LEIRCAENMNYIKAITLLLITVLGAAPAWAQVSVTNSFSVNKTIPDGSSSGVADSQTLDFSGLQLNKIVSLQVNVNISGGFNGDYYAYLVHNGGFAVLLNRVGRTSSDHFGYSDSGLNVTFSDGSPNDIHNYQNIVPPASPLTGTWAPDGRNVDPANALNTDPRTALLGSFNGEDPSGQWTLFVSDVADGAQGSLANWGLVITAVPEPSTSVLIFLGLAGICASRWLFNRSARVVNNL
jgi:subtilisin-like proprotein convertase family protein